MTLSVIIPTRHRNQLLSRCLDALSPARQSADVAGYSVIVTDDGVSSTAEAMVKERYPWAQWTKGPSRGPAANRNHGARVTQNGWLAFTDDDCVPSPQWIAELRQGLAASPVVEGRTCCSTGLTSALDEAPINESGGRLWSCNFAITREMFDRLNGFDERFPLPCFEDTDFLTRLNQLGVEPKFCIDALVDHPARKRLTGAAAAANWESRVYFEHKHRRDVPCSLWLPRHVFKVRLKQAFERRVSMETVPAVWTAFVESIVVRQKVRRWDEMYAQCSVSSAPPPFTG